MSKKLTRYDDAEDTVYDSHLKNQDPTTVEGWPKDEEGELGEIDVDIRYTTKRNDDRFDAPWQDGIVVGGSIWTGVDDMEVYIKDTEIEITELLTDKCLEKMRERIEEGLQDD